METRCQSATKMQSRRSPVNKENEDPTWKHIADQSIVVKLVGCQVLRGEMDDKIWQQLTKDRFKSILDMDELVRKEARLIVDKRRILLYPASPGRSADCKPIFNHRIKFITHTYSSTKLHYISYLYKLSSNTQQLICFETGKQTGSIMHSIRRSIKRLSLESDSMIDTTQDSPNSLSFVSEPIEASETSAAPFLSPPQLVAQPVEGGLDDEQVRASDQRQDELAVVLVEISSSESEYCDESDVEIVDILPQIPFRNYTFENIDM